MNTFFKTFAATAFAVFTITAYAQSTVGELIDGGAKKMTKEQLVTYIAGTKLTGPNRSGEIVMNIDLKADGSFSGSVNNPQRGISTGTFGKWAVDESGKTCTDGRLSAWNMSFKEYFFSYRLGEVMYRTMADSEDRATTVGKGLEPVKTN